MAEGMKRLMQSIALRTILTPGTDDCRLKKEQVGAGGCKKREGQGGRARFDGSVVVTRSTEIPWVSLRSISSLISGEVDLEG